MDTNSYQPHSGEPLWLQRWKIRRARRRSRLMRAIRCWRGKHNPPHNEAFEDMGALSIGGPCTRCPNEVYRELAWIGDVWDFPSAISRKGDITTAHKDAMLDAINEHIRRLSA